MASLVSPKIDQATLPPVGGSVRVRLIVGVIMALFLVSALSSATRTGISEGFDELGHLSYVAELQARPGPVRLEQLRMLDPTSFRFKPTASYINHAAPYYRAMALFGPRIEGHPQSLIWHRLINLAIGALGLGLLLAASLALARTEQEALIAVLGLGCIPTLGPLAGLVNNDNLGFLAGALTLFGSQRFLAARSNAALALTGAGVVLAGAAKLTALMLCGGYFVLFLLIACRFRLLRPAHMAIAAAALLIAAWAPIDLWLTYGSPAPDTPGQHALLVEGARVTGWADRPRLAPLAYLVDFLGQFLASWRPHLDDLSALQTAMFVLPLITVLLAVAGVFLAARSVLFSKATEPTAIIALAGALAIAATFAVHVAFSYQRHLATGWMLDAYARYYLPLVAIVPWATFVLLRRVKRQQAQRLLGGFLIAAPIAFGMLG